MYTYVYMYIYLYIYIYMYVLSRYKLSELYIYVCPFFLFECVLLNVFFLIFPCNCLLCKVSFKRHHLNIFCHDPAAFFEPGSIFISVCMSLFLSRVGCLFVSLSLCLFVSLSSIFLYIFLSPCLSF